MSGVSSKRKSYVLTVNPVNYSLTEGTNIPPPPESPPLPPVDKKKSGIVSHPGIESMPGAFPTEPVTNGRKNSMSTIGTLDHTRGRADSVRTPMSPASAQHPSQDKPHVRRMFSLNSLRQSFSSSRTSLALPRGSHDVDGNGDHLARPESRASTAMASISGDSTRPRTRARRSSTWLRRRSFFLGGNGGDAMLDVVNEDPRESKRFKDSKPAPLLPEVGTLRGGRLNDGNLGWDEGMFKKK